MVILPVALLKTTTVTGKSSPTVILCVIISIGVDPLSDMSNMVEFSRVEYLSSPG